MSHIDPSHDVTNQYENDVLSFSQATEIVFCDEDEKFKNYAEEQKHYVTEALESINLALHYHD